MGLTSSLYKTAQLKSAHIDVNLKVTILLVTMWDQDCKHFSNPLKQKISSSSSITQWTSFTFRSSYRQNKSLKTRPNFLKDTLSQHFEHTNV